MTTGRNQFDREFEAFLAEEQSRVALLYRKLPRPEPDARLDAAVRSMAHRALNPQLVATPRSETRRRRARWFPAFGAAAGIVFAAGIAWRVETTRRSESDQLATPSSDVISVRQLDVPPPPTEPPVSPAPPPPETTATLQAARTRGKAENAAAPVLAESAKPAPAAVREKPAAKVTEQQEEDRPAAAAGLLSKTPPAARAAPAPQAFPARAQKHASEMDAVERKQIMAAGAWQNLHDRDTGESGKDGAKAKALDDKAPGAASTSPSGSAAGPAASTPAMAPPSAGGEAPSPASAARPEPPASRTDVAGEQVRDEPALSSATTGGKVTAAPARSSDPNAALYPEHWLANIRTMLEENRRDEAVRSLAEFRKMYPTYRLPDNLRDLK